MMSDIIFPYRDSLRVEYDKLLRARSFAVKDLESRIEKTVLPLSSQPRVVGRIKTFESYFRKYIRLLKNEISPGKPQITDVMGIRIICPFLDELAAVEDLLKEKFEILEIERKGGDHTFREFGYESIHLLISVPQAIIKKRRLPGVETAEIQIRTILQDAWAEVEHEMIYKAEFNPVDNPTKRKLAAVNASLVLADVVFQEIRSYQRKLVGEMEKRQDSFFRKIEESTDHILFLEKKSFPAKELSTAKTKKPPPPLSAVPRGEDAGGLQSVDLQSIDDLLVCALSAHNRNEFSKAIAVYTQILDMKPDDAVKALICKHRGMAFFAQSCYEEALADFSESLKLDPKSYKAAYYEGIIYSVLQRYPLAVDAFSCSLEINPYQPYCLFRRGQAYYHLGDYPKALGDCEATLALAQLEYAGKFKEMVLAKLKM
jgi:putative GTP pyrophosphokinase